MLKKLFYINFIFLLFNACSSNNENIIIDNDFESLELNDFVEPDFPFINTSLDLRNIGADFPDKNFSSRAIAVKLENKAYMAFDPDMIRWSVAWTGDFVTMKGVAQVSYKDYFNKGDGFPEILGEPVLATGLYPGWTNYFPDFKDPRTTTNPTDHLTWGALPKEIGRWKGTYTIDEKTIVRYSVGDTDIFDYPQSLQVGDQTIFVRTLKIEPHKGKLYSVIAEFNHIDETKVQGNELHIYFNDSVKIIGTDIENKLSIVDKRYVILEIPAENKESLSNIYFWSGTQENITKISKSVAQLPSDFPDIEKGGKPYWQEKVYTRGIVVPDTAAYVLDILTLPVPNPWKRNVRAADIAFFKNGTAALLTFDGDIWMLKNINKKLDKLEWSRFASGFFEAMSIEVFNDEIYVFGREGVIKVHDLNKDGNADYYENYVHNIVQSIDSREWAADMRFDNKGNIFLAKGGGTIPRDFPSIAETPAQTFRASTIHAGTILKVSPDGTNTTIYATGLRLPYIGLHPETGFLTASDQQGNYVPASPIYKIGRNDYFGVIPANHSETEPPTRRPITWIPHRIDQSSISQRWLNSGKMGPLNNTMLHFSFGRPGIFTVLQDDRGKNIQGGVIYIKADYPAPVLKGNLHPKDGQLYIAGFNLWGSNSNGISALTRLRYTGEPFYQPLEFEAGKEGIILRFNEKLDSQIDLSKLKVKRWNYERTEKYGSGHFLLNGEPGEETLPVLEAHLSSDEKAVLLLIPNMTEVMQMELDYTFKTKNGVEISDEFYFTINDTKNLDLAQGFKTVAIDLSKLTLSEKELLELQQSTGVASLALGKDLFQKYACIGCHSLDKDSEGKYGPALAKLYNSKREFTDGTNQIADDDYIIESILDPKKKILIGFGDEMPSYTGVLMEHEVSSLLLYIKTL